MGVRAAMLGVVVMAGLVGCSSAPSDPSEQTGESAPSIEVERGRIEPRLSNCEYDQDSNFVCDYTDGDGIINSICFTCAGSPSFSQ